MFSSISKIFDFILSPILYLFGGTGGQSSQNVESQVNNLDDLDITTAEAGRDIPVVFGTRIIKGSNVVWYGDLRIEAVRKAGGKK